MTKFSFTWFFWHFMVPPVVNMIWSIELRLYYRLHSLYYRYIHLYIWISEVCEQKKYLTFIISTAEHIKLSFQCRHTRPIHFSVGFEFKLNIFIHFTFNFPIYVNCIIQWIIWRKMRLPLLLITIGRLVAAKVLKISTAFSGAIFYIE